MHRTAEEQRLSGARAGVGWRTWGPYPSERQWFPVNLLIVRALLQHYEYFHGDTGAGPGASHPLIS